MRQSHRAEVYGRRPHPERTCGCVTPASEPERWFGHTWFTMKPPIPTSVLSCARYTVAAYDISAFSSIPHDVGGRALSKAARSVPRRPPVLPVIIVTTLTCLIAILAVAAAGADTIPNTNGAVVVRYSGKIAFGAAPGRQNDTVFVESILKKILFRKDRVGDWDIDRKRPVVDVYCPVVRREGECDVIMLGKPVFTVNHCLTHVHGERSAIAEEPASANRIECCRVYV